MRYSLLASASLMAFAFCVATAPANAADCGCRDAVRAALSLQKMAPPAPMPVVKPPEKRAAARVAHRTAPACNCGPAPRAAAAHAQGGYDYRVARAVDTYPYTHHWTVAPQGYVPPVVSAAAAAAAAGIPPYDGPTNLPPYGPMPAGYGDAAGAGDAYASAEAPAITVDQQGWIGGVGYERSGGGGGGGGGGGLTLTLAQPDSQNGPSYNSFGQSYGGDYQSANQVNAWRTQAFTPPANSGSGSK